MADFVVPSILFLLFSVFSAVGAYFLTSQYRGQGSRTTAVVAALLTLFFFALLFFGLLAILPEGSLSRR